MSWLDHLNADPREWLLEAEPWTRYRTTIDLLDEKGAEERETLLSHPRILDLLERRRDWIPKPVTRHNDAKLSYYNLMVLSELGLTAQDPGMSELCDQAAAHRDEGHIAILQQLPQAASADYTALPCDSPIILYTLLHAEYQAPGLTESVDRLTEAWQTPQGWFCDLPFVRGHHRKHGIGCPMAGLMALQVFSRFPELHSAECSTNAFGTLEYHRSLGTSIYYFGRSRKFWTMKYPFIWYNALYIADVLSRFPRFFSEPLFQELIDWILDSQDELGRYKPTSMFINYRGWDFANKKEASPWITLLCGRILKRRFG